VGVVPQAQGSKALREIRERLRFDFGTSPIGRILFAVSETGLRWLAVGDDLAQMEMELRARFPKAMLVRDPDGIAMFATALDGFWQDGSCPADLGLDPMGTAFQKSVWSLLRQIPRGTTITYGELARKGGNPKSVRAVAQACGANPILCLVPCHRVIGANGALTGFRAGIERKRWLLEQELAIST
jgi:AraC family transcriptional regulator of adaptative response/methylated-DNA-[protein]-cysteine methyltransferase